MDAPPTRTRRAAERWGVPQRLLGLPLHSVTVDDLHAYITRVVRADEQALILNLNVHCINLAHSHPWLRELLDEAQLVFCDGDGVRLGLRLLDLERPPKITYAHWIWQLAEHAAREGHSMYFLGARPEVAERAALCLRARHPTLRVVGTHHGYFDREGPENEAVLANVNRARPDILLVGMGMPTQERWLHDHRDRLDAHVLLTGGAVFDYASGRVRRAPRWMIDAQMEWMYRFVQDPRRLFGRYVVGNPTFLARVVRSRFTRRA